MKQEAEALAAVAVDVVLPGAPRVTLEEIERLDRDSLRQFADKIRVQSSLTRSLVSFQANKTRAAYRWYKYKEAFSAPLIEHLLSCHASRAEKIFDPFAGSGTTLFVASAAGASAEGIELLPIGQQIITARKDRKSVV